MSDIRPGLSRHQSWVWNPAHLEWWIGLLFMIGAALFALGSTLYLGGNRHEFTIEAVFFTGSIFFTSAAYCQFHQSRGASKIVYWSALSQFVGTLLFNMNTFDAFFDLGWIARDVLVWIPDIFGSILFQISGSLAMYEVCHRWGCWDIHRLAWWIGSINFMGCVAFLVSATLAFSTPDPVSDLLVTWSTTFTLIGACCFFVGAFLMWPDLARRKEDIPS